MKKIFLLIAVALIVSETLSAQNTLQNQFGNQFGGSASGTGSNLYDRNGNPIDTTSVIDASTIPIGLFSWTIDKRFGNMTTIPIDTLQTGFQNSNDVGGMTGHYSALGNLGAPRISHAFFARMKRCRLFINASRGPVVDNAALLQAVRKRPHRQDDSWERDHPC